MNSLVVRILVALITFTIGVWVAKIWLEPVVMPPSIDISLQPPSASRLEMVFVLDTTGSMGGLLDGAKQRIWGIVNEVMQQDSHPSVRVGLVAYRDRGDQYVTQVLPVTEDLDKVYTTLMDYRPAGGGDTAEDVRTALAEGVYKAGWSSAAPGLSQIIFLVGDAPPHDDYDDAADTLVTAAKAVQKGMIVNTIQCGMSGETTRAWQAIAARGQGQYFAIAQDGGVQAVTTPYDEQLGELATKLGETFVVYGGGGGAEGEAKRVEVKRGVVYAEESIATRAAPMVKADRAYNKAINSMAYIGDLLQDIENGSLKLEDVKTEDLPQELKTLSPAERQQEVEKRLAERREIRSQILALSKQRQAFINDAQKKLGGREAGFDAVVARALKEQMARKTR